MFGSVVIGVGMAGNARIRDLLALQPSSAVEKLTVEGFVSRRTLGEVLEVPQIPLEEALCRSDIQVAFVCTENASHEEHIRRFLEEGMHVCVEYPMTLSYTSAVDLWDLAEEKGLVLHEEHIELFTPDFKQLKKDIAGKKLEEGSLHFTGGLLKPDFGFPSFSGIARLTWLVELFGELTLKAATLVEDEQGKHMKMTAHLLTKDQKPLTWIEERAEGLSRAKHVHLRFDSCTVTELPAAQRESVGLFMQDLVLFRRKLQGDVPPDELQAERVRILHCLRLADSIRQVCHGSVS